MRGKYQMHKQLGIALEEAPTPGARHLPFPGIYFAAVVSGGGGGAGGSPSDFEIAGGRPGFASYPVTAYVTARDQTPERRVDTASGWAGSGGPPGVQGYGGEIWSLVTDAWSLQAARGEGGIGYGDRTPAPSQWPYDYSGAGRGGMGGGWKEAGERGLTGKTLTRLVG